MPTSPKNNRSQGSRRYTTRQIMELTEKRRKQMDEEARLRKLLAPLAQETDEQGKTSVSETPDMPVESSFQNAVEETVVDVSSVSEGSGLDGKTVAGFFREAPESPAEKSVSGLIEEEFNKAIDETAPLTESPAAEVKDKGDPFLDLPEEAPVVQESVPFILEKEIKPKASLTKAKGLSHPAVHQVLDVFVFGLSMGLMSLMMIHLLWAGWARHYYDQSPFVLIMALSMVWFNRVNFRRREEWFWGSTVIVAGGLGVFIASVLEGHSYIELAGFLIVCFGLFLWRYQEECACRLFFPLAALFFIFAPPTAWEQALVKPLNDCVYHLSSWVVNSFHVPVHYDGNQFRVPGGAIFFQGDPTVFRSLGIGVLWALTCLSFQRLVPSWSILLFLSVVGWTVAANIVRVSTTGLILENFGFEYATTFFTNYSVYVVLLLMLAGIFLTAGLLPHQEDE